MTPNEIYNNIEANVRLNRLEKMNNLSIALRHIMRHLHPKENIITLGNPETVDSLLLETVNLPADPNQLFHLIQQVFKRKFN